MEKPGWAHRTLQEDNININLLVYSLVLEAECNGS